MLNNGDFGHFPIIQRFKSVPNLLKIEFLDYSRAHFLLPFYIIKHPLIASKNIYAVRGFFVPLNVPLFSEQYGEHLFRPC
jgi:hypothetical protein